MKKLLLRFLFVLGVIFIVSGCEKGQQSVGNFSKESKDRDTNQGPSSVGLENPASTYCVENGGKSEIRKNEFGEMGYCIFDDDSECEEWSFYQNECQKGVKKSKKDNNNTEINNEK